MPKNTRDSTIEAMAEMLLREDAQWEMRQLMEAVPAAGLTACEILAMLAILRGAKERIDAQQRQPARVLELVRPATRKRRSCF